MAFKFTTPTVLEGPIGDHRLFQFYRQDRGISILRFGEDFLEYRFPSEDEIALADNVWLGGHEHVVDDAMAAALTNAGYGAFLEAI